MRLDGPEQLRVSRRARELDDRAGRDLLEPGPLLEAPVLFGMDELEHVDARVEAVRGVYLLHLGVNEGASELTAERDAVMAVNHEVEATGLVDRDRWHRAVAKGLVEVVEAAAEPAATRAEKLVEVDRAIHRADDSLDRDLAHAEVVLPEHADPAGHIPQGQERLTRHRSESYAGHGSA